MSKKLNEAPPPPPYDDTRGKEKYIYRSQASEPILGIPEWRTIIMVTYFAIVATAFMAVMVLLAKWANGELR